MRRLILRFLGLEERLSILEHQYKTFNLTLTRNSDTLTDDYLNVLGDLEDLTLRVKELEKPKHWFSK